MKHTSEASISRDRQHDLIGRLRGLKAEGIIDNGTYHDYMVLILRAITLDQLKEISHDLRELATGYLLEETIPSSRPIGFLQPLLAQPLGHEAVESSFCDQRGENMG